MTLWDGHVSRHIDGFDDVCEKHTTYNINLKGRMLLVLQSERIVCQIHMKSDNTLTCQGHLQMLNRSWSR